MLLLSAFALTSCGDDDEDASSCQTCELELLGVSVSSEYCEDGDNVIVTTSGVSETLEGVSLDDIVAAQEAAGATCN